MQANEDYKFTYDAEHDEVIFAIYNPVSKNVYIEFFNGTTLQEPDSPRLDTVRLYGVDNETGHIQGIYQVDTTHYILHLYQ